MILFSSLFLAKKGYEWEQRMIAREKAHQKWLFDALYSINNKVVLPEQVVESIKEKESKEEFKASVYSPTDDPMGQFEGKKDDWYGKQED